MTRKTCILSGREIPDGKYSREHWLPRSVAPCYITSLPYNIQPSIKIFNQVKSNLYPCQWMKWKYELCYNAYLRWNIKPSDKRLLGEAVLNGMPEFNPCKLCVANKFKEFCIKTKHKDICL